MKTCEINLRDPFVLTYGGKYYLYGTRGATCWGPADGFDVYVGEDLENWEGPTVCFAPDEGFWATENFWAPEVHLWNGRFYMLASFKAPGICRGTSVLVADSPMGPFRPHSRGSVTPADWECLDGTLCVSRDGAPYMIFCHEWVQIGDGTVCALPLTDDLSAPAGEPRVLFRASQGLPWIQQKHHARTGIDGYVTDGPSVYRTQAGGMILLWSSFSAEGYAEAMAVPDNGDVTGQFTLLPRLLFEKDGGHGMIFRTLEGELMLALHSPNEHLLERPRFYPLEEREGELYRK